MRFRTTFRTTRSLGLAWLGWAGLGWAGLGWRWHHRYLSRITLSFVGNSSRLPENDSILSAIITLVNLSSTHAMSK